MDPYALGLSAEALLLAPLLVAGYALALRRHPASPARIASYLAGVALIVAAFLSPLQAIALHYLLTAHLLQNVVLAEWAPVLCVLGLPPSLAAALARYPAIRAVTHPLVALPLWLVTYFVWHIPPIYDAALEHPSSLLHLEHLSYFLAGAALWWPIVHGTPRRLATGAKAGYLFAAFVLASPLGLLLALLPDPVYTFYERGPGLWGFSPLEDQQIAGLTMAAEQAIVFFAAFTFCFFRFLQEEEDADGPESAAPWRSSANSG